MTRAPQHYSVSAREIKHLARLLRCFDITIGEHWNADHGFDVPDRLVFSNALIKVRTRAAVDRECLDSCGLGDARYSHAVTIVTVPSGADLQRDRHTHGAHDCLQYS